MLDIVEKAAFARVDRVGDDEAAHIEGEEGPERSLRAAGQRDRRAISLWDEEGAEGRARLERETEQWARFSGAVNVILRDA